MLVLCFLSGIIKGMLLVTSDIVILLAYGVALIGVLPGSVASITFLPGISEGVALIGVPSARNSF